MFVTSRAITVDQQSRIDGVVKFDSDDLNLVMFWNDDDRVNDAVISTGMRIMTYDKIINILRSRNAIGCETLSAVKVVVFDECHSLFSDTFIADMVALQVWIRGALRSGEKLILGLTATPGILQFNAKSWGVAINRMNKQVLMAHTANQLICTTFELIPRLIDVGHFRGKTLIMCPSVRCCEILNHQIPDSTVLVSKSSNYATPEMKMIRDYISKYEKFPDKYMIPSSEEMARRKSGKHSRSGCGTWHDLRVLITTTTAREGYNLCEDSGVKNIISCFGDDLHLTQICGRARYDLDNIVVAKTKIPYDNYDKDSYLSTQRNQFYDYMKDQDNTAWFPSVAHLVRHDIHHVKRFLHCADRDRFMSFVNSKWLVPPGTDAEECRKYRIWRDEDKADLVEMSLDCEMFSCDDKYVTFNRVVRLLSDNLGYTVDTGRFIQGNKKYTYKLVTSYQADSTYEPLFQNEDTSDQTRSSAAAEDPYKLNTPSPLLVGPGR